MPRKIPFDSRFIRDEVTGCLEWQGARDKDGYGVLAVSTYGTPRAHRFAYSRAHGEIPRGMVVRHKCDNPCCCELDHLELGTTADNSADMVARRRSLKGELGTRAKLTDEMVLEIRKLYSEGMTQTEIATRFPVTQSSVSLIVLRKQWTHI